MQEHDQHGEMSQLRKEIYGSMSSRLAMTPQLLISETTTTRKTALGYN